MADLVYFNIDDGLGEGLVRGLRSGFLTADDYRRIANGENLEDLRTALEDTDYGTFLQDEPSPLQTSTILRKCHERLAEEFDYVRAQSVGEMAKFMDYVRQEAMIDNVVMLIQGTINNKNPKDLLARCDPLGYFDEMKTIPGMDFTHGYEDLYRTILVDTPLGPYFEEFLNSKHVHTHTEGQSAAAQGGPSGATAVVQHGEVHNILTETDLEILRNFLKKCWMESFYRFCINGSENSNTAEVMGHILKTEADYRVLMVTLNALNSPLGTAQNLDERNALYPDFGYLYPEGTDKLMKATSDTAVRAALEPYLKYAQLYDQCKQFYEHDSNVEKATQGRYKSIEDLLYVESVRMFENAFEEQYHYGIIYAWVKLRIQEMKNIEWMANMIVLKKKEHVEEIVPIFAPRVPRREGGKRESKGSIDTLIAALHDSHSDKEAAVRLEKLMGELKPETVNSRDQYGRTALMGVARWGTEKQVENCLKMGADPLLCDRSRFSVLHYMARRKEKPPPQQVSNMVDLLIAANAEPHAPSKCGETPLQLAVRGNAHPDVARELVEKIVYLNFPRTLYGMPYHSRQVLGCSAKPSAASCSVTHPPSTARMSESSLALRDLIHRAFEKGGYPASVVEQALSDGADINTRDLHGRTALLLCARYGTTWTKALAAKLGT
ncbi:hypothetical protein FOZ63_032656 [Perkinsus olseni]|uniref:V-type proton ATPase subunit d 1 n=1 Tax=Perkinsus olseni TaxID=32597 RepID=A0A7J6UGX8_PEROL|nr:hypothetical protein FOZ63_032656 [Perkinsus olseni]